MSTQSRDSHASRMTVRFWGVRGSIASPGPETARVGGNTSCVEVIAESEGHTTRIVLDAGTGMRSLGNSLMREAASSGSPVDVTVLLSHLHWDHIQGIPFFTPLYVPGSRVRFVAGATTTPLRDSLRRQMSAPHFPVDLADVPSTLSFQEIRDRGRFSLGPVDVAVAKANHPDSVHAYRLTFGDRTIVYATDTEHYSCVDRRLVTLAQDADVLIYDAQYTPEEYSGAAGMSRVGWGHSTYEAATELARAASVKQLVLFHHDPARDDDAVAEIERLARGRFDRTVAAREGAVIALQGARSIEAA
jgi:phosphoribosyl 1,2-cyclic phosphodiesterase